MTAAERRAFNDGLQAAILAISIKEIEGSPLCPGTGDNVCLGCMNLPEKERQMIARINALQYGRHAAQAF
jgi:hypothetical protein